MYSKLAANEEIRAYQPEHVKELVSYFQKRGLNISCFKDLFKSVYIVRIDNVSCEFKSCKEVILFFRSFYEEDKKRAVKEHIERKLRALNEKNIY